MNREIKFRARDNKHPAGWDYSEDDSEHFWALVKLGFLPDVCQYTGLKDKHGKEIYEGDIFRMDERPLLWKLPEEGIGVVEWIGAGFYPFSSNLADCEKVEIIGNIYENPELLKNEPT